MINIKKSLAATVLALLWSVTAYAKPTMVQGEFRFNPILSIIIIAIMAVVIVGYNVIQYKGFKEIEKNGIEHYAQVLNQYKNMARGRSRRGGYSNGYNNNNNNDWAFQQHMRDHQDMVNRQHEEWAMEEGRKSVTPFDMGGYVQGYGFNPSDTMAQDSMNSMNNMNDMNMNNMF